jgi:hypothetical protein
VSFVPSKLDFWMMKQEYKILPQNERDNAGNNNGIPLRSSTSSRKSCCFTTFIILAILAILSGIIALSVSLAYPDEFAGAVSGYWAAQDPGNSTDDATTTEEPVTLKNVTFAVEPEPPKKKPNKSKEKVPEDPEDLAPEPDATTTLEPPILSLDGNGTTMAPVNVGNGTVSSTEDGETSSSGEEESEEESEEGTSAEDVTTTTTTPAPKKKKKGGSHATTTATAPKSENSTSSTENPNDEWNERVEKYVEETEKFLENATGIRRAEIVVPMFMFVCFLLSLLLASCCCYLLMRRRDSRRRRILGKIITDLQSGDSKSILLDQEMDD